MDLTEAEDTKKRWQEYIENGGGNGNPLQNSCLGNPMDRGAWRRAPVHRVAKSQTRLSMRMNK